MDSRVEIFTDYIKLDSFLKYAVFAASGGEAKELIKDGFVTVNGAACFERGKKLRGGDTVSCGGMTVTVFKRNEN